MIHESQWITDLKHVEIVWCILQKNFVWDLIKKQKWCHTNDVLLANIYIQIGIAHRTYINDTAER